MVNLLGFDLTPGLEAIKGSAQDLFSRLDLSGPQQGQAVQGRDPFAGLSYGGHDPFSNLQLGGDPFAGLGGQLGAKNPQTGYDPLAAYQFNPVFAAFDQASAKAAAKHQADAAAQQQQNQTNSNYGANPNGGSASGGLEPGVAQWASQVQATFGGMAGLDPDTMLAIMTNESHGNPNAYNSAGNAYGLFQQVGFGDSDPNWGANTNGQFQAARQLAQQKLAGINAAYAANGLNPDARTRARDFALAWAGHFDYSTGTLNPNSRDIGSNQTAQQLADIFLANYDRIKAGRQQAPAAVAGGTGMLVGPWAFPVVGYQGQVQNHWGTDETGASDIMAAAGTPIVAMHGGRVIDASWDQYGGNTVAIQDEQGRVYYYAHMQSAAQVRPGQTVQAGTPLGAVGNTGDAAGGPTHLHLGITAPNTNIKLGNGAQGGAGWSWGNGPQDNAVGLLTWVLHGGSAPTGGGGAQYR